MSATILRFPEGRGPSRAPRSRTITVDAIEDVRSLIQRLTPNRADPRGFYNLRDEADGLLFDMIHGDAA